MTPENVSHLVSISFFWLGVSDMATQQNFRLEISNPERVWLQHAVKKLLDQLQRARKREAVGSEVYSLRAREIEALEALSRRL